MEKRVFRLLTDKVMVEWTLQVGKQGRAVNITQAFHETVTESLEACLQARGRREDVSQHGHRVRSIDQGSCGAWKASDGDSSQETQMKKPPTVQAGMKGIRETSNQSAAERTGG